MTDAVAGTITGFTRLVTGAQARWLGCAPAPVQRIYYGNHSSHADFVLIWASLPPALRAHTRPVAGADYWEKGAVKRYPHPRGAERRARRPRAQGRDGEPGRYDRRGARCRDTR